MRTLVKYDIRLIGRRISFYRKIKGMTQLELSKKVGISKSYLSKIEAINGKINPSLNVLDMIIGVLEISLNQLVSRTYKEDK